MYTVIINVLNGAQWLDQALSQITDQTALPCSIIILDNNSTDSLQLDIKKFISTLSIPIIYHRMSKTVPLYKARNIALSYVSTPYFCFLDIDDLWSNDKNRSQLSYLAANSPISVLTTDYYIYNYDSGEKILTHDNTFSGHRLTLFSIFKNYSVHFSSAMFRTSHFKNANIFHPKLTILGDLCFFLSMPVNSIHNLSEPLSYYVYHKDNTGYKLFYKLFTEVIYLFWVFVFKDPVASFLISSNLLTRAFKSYLVRIIIS